MTISFSGLAANAASPNEVMPKPRAIVSNSYTPRAVHTEDHAEEGCRFVLMGALPAIRASEAPEVRGARLSGEAAGAR